MTRCGGISGRRPERAAAAADPFARRIIHVDMDAFYAAVEMREVPAYRGHPLIVGGAPDQRGTVATCNYEARKFGIHSAMPSATARRLCPQAIFVKPRFDLYRAVSAEVQEIFRCYTRKVEPLSLDEAYLDVTGCRLLAGIATDIARDIRRRIFERTRLTASAGVSYNKFLAKIASDMNKPDGLTVIRPGEGPRLIATLPIGKFFGIGPVTESKMKRLGIHTGADLRRWPLERLRPLFGKHAEYYHRAARGLDLREVQAERQRKSVGSETTFLRDLDDFGQQLQQLRLRAREVALDLQERSLTGKTVTVKVKFSDFRQVTRSHSFDRPLASYRDMVEILPALLRRAVPGRRAVRLLGVTVSNLVRHPDDKGPAQRQLL